ncbi:MAG: 16S rRNA (uracil(1498)-N(3))-methyltransferase [Tenericutes bacterium]|nr:16S rRNA (uracil(1498)-N(3))-methyltransferase [Mycoplasmatota bacterium]
MQQYFGVSKKDNTLLLNQNDLNHIKTVMRMKENDEIIVVYENKSYICSLNKDLMSANIKEIFKEYKEKNNFKVYVPLLSEEKMSFILQHGTELGIMEFVVVMYSHCKYKLPKKDFDKKLIRWNKILKEAAEQSYRLEKPKLEKIIEIKDIESDANVNILCSLDKNNVKQLTDVLTLDNCSDTMNIVFGPEGGLSNIEEDILVEKGYTKTSLGDDVLRTETVPLMIASIKKYLEG